MDTTFRVRYRGTQADGTIAALMVEGRSGSFYLFSGGRLQLKFDRAHWSPRVDGLLERAGYRWVPIECDEQVPLDGLPAYIDALQAAHRPDTTPSYS